MFASLTPELIASAITGLMFALAGIGVYAKTKGPPAPKVDSVVAGVGIGYVSKEAEERRDALDVRRTIAQESIAASLAVLADRERHQTQEMLEDLPDKITEALKALGKVP